MTVTDIGDKFADDFGNRIGYCNSCGEECDFAMECCEDGEVVPYDDDPNED